MKKGVLYLIPVPLAPEGTRQTAQTALPYLAEIRHFIVEDIRSARRFLRAADSEFPIDSCEFVEMDKHSGYSFDERFLNHAVQGHSIGVLSEAGCPAVADPGSYAVAAAHEQGITVRPIPGPNSMILALMGSGFPGQVFTFHGYIPIELKDRKNFILQMEREAAQGHTQIFMDTPYRNHKLFMELTEWLRPETALCIASNLTASNEQIHTRKVKDWRKVKPNLKKVPAVFLLGTTE